MFHHDLEYDTMLNNIFQQNLFVEKLVGVKSLTYICNRKQNKTTLEYERNI